MSLCEIPDCPKAAANKRMCWMHYYRVRRFGDPHARPIIRGDTTLRFWSKVNKTETCWLWTGLLEANGYGIFHVGPRTVRAHRWAYFDGSPPLGKSGTMDLDHLCRVRHCVRPSHMEEVPHLTNLLRGDLVLVWERARARTHCKHGHAFDAANTYIRKNGNRSCKACLSARTRQYRAAARAIP